MMKDDWEIIEICHKKNTDELIINEDLIDGSDEFDIELYEKNNDSPLVMTDQIDDKIIDDFQYDIIEIKNFKFYAKKIKNSISSFINNKNIIYIVNNKKYELLFFALMIFYCYLYYCLFNKYDTLEKKHNLLYLKVLNMEKFFLC